MPLGAVRVGRVIVVSGVPVVAGLGVGQTAVGGRGDGASGRAGPAGTRGRRGAGAGGHGPTRGRGARRATVGATGAAAERNVGQRDSWGAMAPVPRDGPQPFGGVASDAPIRLSVVGTGGEKVRAPGGGARHGGDADGVKLPGRANVEAESGSPEETQLVWRTDGEQRSHGGGHAAMDPVGASQHTATGTLNEGLFVQRDGDDASAGLVGGHVLDGTGVEDLFSDDGAVIAQG